ncbi:MAG TPA: sulfite exporter TauE/SafE family protein [Thermoanaerobaculia bacterium]|nr:sulfite exporter TauE/SafE family protein [Thermoanaerobaculia bacterium]
MDGPLPLLLACVLLFGVGTVAGTLNVVAGGGSLLALPVLIFLGVPAGIANGTNRVAILMQNVAATASFHGHRLIDPRALAWAAAPATVGAALGTWLALSLGDSSFQRVLAWIMIAVSLWTLLGRRQMERWRRGSEERALRWPALAAGFFVVGIYGGFVQAGVGFLILAVTSLAGLDLVRGNAVKVLSVLCFTVISLTIFAWQGKVVWGLGLALGLGHVVGGLLGVRLTVRKGDRWIERVVTIAVIVFAIRLWMTA